MKLLAGMYTNVFSTSAILSIKHRRVLCSHMVMVHPCFNADRICFEPGMDETRLEQHARSTWCKDAFCPYTWPTLGALSWHTCANPLKPLLVR